MTRILLIPFLFFALNAVAKPATKSTDKGKTMYATMETTLGTFKLKLFPDKAPKTVENFVTLAKGTQEWMDPKTGKKVKRPLYNGTIFHRVIEGFMIQGGDPKGNGTGGSGHTFADEINPDLNFSKAGVLAMANSGGGTSTNSSQFFVTVGPATHLNGNHTIFGEVVDHMDVVTKISKVPVNFDKLPDTPVVLKSVKITEE